VVAIVKIASKVLRTVLSLALVALGIYFWQGGTWQDLTRTGVDALFAGDQLTTFYADNCPGDEAGSDKCECLVSPVWEDLQSRFTPEEMAAIDQDEAQVQAELKASLKRQSKTIRACMLARKGPKAKETATDWWHTLKDWAEENGEQWE
jgi:hypothetical protein